MNKFIIILLVLKLTWFKASAQATYTSAATGNWNAPGTWVVSAGADVPADGIPDIDDHVIIQAAHTVTVNVNSAVNNITLQGSAGTRLNVSTGMTLQVNGTMNGPSTTWSNQIIITAGTGKVQFIGNSRALFGANWDAAPHAWTAEINLSSNAQVGTSSTNVKFGTLTVTQGTFSAGAAGAWRDLRLSMDLLPATANGSMTIAAGARVITGRCGEKSNAAGTYCQSITINGTLEVHGTILSGQTITVNNGGVLSVRKSNAGGLASNPTGVGVTNFVYNAGSTVEYADDPAYLGRADMGAEINQSVGKNLYNVTADHSTGINVVYTYNQLAIFTLRRGNVISSTSNVITYGAASTLVYNGTIAQNAANTGGAPAEIEFPSANGPFNLTINNTGGANVTLFNPRTINGLLTLTNGRFFTTAVNLLTLSGTASSAGASNVSFVHGPLRKLGQTAFTFPVGKNNDLQICGIGAGGVASSTPFWTENFNNGCIQNCSANSYSGANGAWSVVNGPGTNGNFANEWFVSCSENGEAVGNCGLGCGSNATLHLASIPCTLCAFFCPTGDCGASYNAGPTFGGENPSTDKRAVSPTISTIGRSGISVSFKYIEQGQAALDDASLDYSIDNGATWNLAVNMAKTNNAGCGGQGRWTAFTVALPATCDNIATLKIAFRWVNNSDGTGTDPSFAVDDVTLSTVEFDSYTAEYFRQNPKTTFNNVLNAPLDHISSCEYWRIDRSIGTSPRTVTLSWDNNSCGVSLLSDLRVAYFNGASWSDMGTNAAAGSTSCGLTTCGTIPSNAINTFGPFTLASVSPQNPLPVSLLNFYAEKRNKSVDLTWITASEESSDYFTLEKSTDKINFSLLAIVNAAGTTKDINEYKHTDENPYTGINYYRLMQTDFNGKASSCGMVAVKFSFEQYTLVIPDRGNDQIKVVLPDIAANAKLSLTDVAGRIISSLNSGGTNIALIDMKGKAGGVYFVKVEVNSETFFSKVFY